MIDSELNEYIKTQIKAGIDEILHPTVEIVTTNPIPKLASPDSVGYDIQANLENIQEKFMKDAYVLRKLDVLHEALWHAFDDDDRELVERLWEEIDTTEYNTIQGIVIKPGGKCLIPTGIFTAFPGLYRTEILSRSGNALKYEVIVLNEPGTIEGDYKNEWGVIIKNLGDSDFVIRQGDRIAQVAFSLVIRPNFVQKDTVSDLSGTDRGGGFGHTGK